MFKIYMINIRISSFLPLLTIMCVAIIIHSSEAWACSFVFVSWFCCRLLSLVGVSGSELELRPCGGPGICLRLCRKHADSLARSLARSLTHSESEVFLITTNTREAVVRHQRRLAPLSAVQHASGMVKDEVVLFKQYDSDRQRGVWKAAKVVLAPPRLVRVHVSTSSDPPDRHLSRNTKPLIKP